MGYVLGGYTYAVTTRDVPRLLSDLRIERARLEEAELRARELRADMALRAASLATWEADLSAREVAVHDPASQAHEFQAGTTAAQPVPGESESDPSFFEGGIDVEPGTYRSPGPASGGFGVCSWASGRPGDVGSIEGHAGYGPAVAVIQTGSLFVTRGCQDWERAD
ncbi:MAG: hypothetical protein M3276_09095 [Actinomycetota bacterium]|nr:hypothetical protein [Actinomycetota bacterium]